jgi:hypothetical protein
MNEDDFWADLKSRIREWRNEGTRDCGKDKVPTTNESEFLVPEAYIMYCPRCGNKWATRKKGRNAVNAIDMAVLVWSFIRVI